MKLQTVHLRVNDEATGRPTPCRIRITDPDGREFPPHGRPLEFSAGRGEDVGGQLKIGGRRWWSIDGSCEIELPPGDVHVEIRKGIRYFPVAVTASMPAGKMSLRFNLRKIDARRSEAVAIDARCHFGSPHAAALDGAAEGLDAVNLLIEPRRFLGHDGIGYDSVPNAEAFSGQAPALQAHGTEVFVNTHNRHPVLGSLGLLHSHRAVYPLTFGGPDATDDWSLEDWAGQCHRKKGFVTWTDAFLPGRGIGWEALALAALGKIDALELTPDNCAPAMRAWYRLLAAGIHLPLNGASARAGNNRPLGALRTLVSPAPDQAGPPLRAACPVVTSGPLLSFWSDERQTLIAEVASAGPFEQVELLVNGNVAAAAAAEPAGDGFLARVEHVARGTGWAAARVIGQQPRSGTDLTAAFAHSSAISLGNRKPDADAVAWVIAQLEAGMDWVEHEGRFSAPKAKAHLLETFRSAVETMRTGRSNGNP